MEKISKICIVGPGLNMGGVERATTNLANYFSDQGYSVVFISIFKGKHFFNLHKNIEFIEPENFNIKKLSIFKTILFLRRNIIKNNPDTVLAFTKFYSALTLISLWNKHINVFVSERSSPFYKWPKKVSIFSKFALMIKKPAGVISQTKIACQYQSKYYPKNTPFNVIPNPVRKIKLYPEIKREKILLAVGRFNDPSKGFDRLLKAFSKINSKDWKLIFAGGTINGEPLKQLAEDLQIANNVEFLGTVENIDYLFARAGIFVIPSRSEGFPNALCEAMAAGLPVISFDFVAGPADLIKNKYNGIIVPDGDIIGLANTIDYLIEDHNLRNILGANAISIGKELDINTISEKYLKFILQKLK